MGISTQLIDFGFNHFLGDAATEYLFPYNTIWRNEKGDWQMEHLILLGNVSIAIQQNWETQSIGLSKLTNLVFRFGQIDPYDFNIWI